MTFLYKYVVLIIAICFCNCTQYDSNEDDNDNDDKSSMGNMMIGGPNGVVMGPNGASMIGGPNGIVMGQGNGNFRTGASAVNNNGRAMNGHFTSNNNNNNFNFNNNGGSIIMSSSTGISQSCNNNVCQTCINGKCFPRNYQTIKTYSSCPVVACDNNCNSYDMLIYKDNCVICQCQAGTATREPCNSQSDCSSDGKCQNNICKYTSVPNNLPKACDFDFECKSTDECASPKCVAGAKVKHVERVSCVFENQCPNGTSCRKMTCYYDSPASNHQQGVSCVFDYQCQSGYSCRDMTCFYTGKKHGTTSCALPSQCNPNENCINMTCVPRT